MRGLALGVSIGVFVALVVLIAWPHRYAKMAGYQPVDVYSQKAPKAPTPKWEEVYEFKPVWIDSKRVVGLSYLRSILFASVLVALLVTVFYRRNLAPKSTEQLLSPGSPPRESS